jgi:hypothetical protein
MIFGVQFKFMLYNKAMRRKGALTLEIRRLVDQYVEFIC